MLNHRKILLVGAYPPPYGGVSVHLERFLKKYKEQQGYSIKLFDLRKGKLYDGEKEEKYSLLKAIKEADIVHFHLQSNIKIILMILCKILKKKIVYTKHNSRIKSNFFFNLISILADQFILVNADGLNIEDEKLKSEKFNVIPAFIEPSAGDALPETISKYLKKDHFILSTNCSNGDLIKGKHIYGFDIIIEALGILLKNNPAADVMLFLVDPGGHSLNIINSVLEKSSKENKDRIIHITENINYSALIEGSDIVIRATRTDGDSLSVREALYYRTPVIASDCAKRPPNTILFKDQDASDLAQKMEALLKKRILPTYENIDFGAQVLEVYGKIKF